GSFSSFFFFGLVVADALVALYLHRAVFAVVALLLVLLIFSGVQPYHFRFPGLEYEQRSLQFLTACEQEIAEQKCLDQQMKLFDGLSQVNGAAAEFDKAQDELTWLTEMMNDPQIWQQFKKFLDLLPEPDERRKLLDEWKNQELAQAQKGLDESIEKLRK